jgi:hypothetical protein
MRTMGFEIRPLSRARSMRKAKKDASLKDFIGAQS